MCWTRAGSISARAAKASGVSAKMVRHYESIGRLASIERTQAGYRICSNADLHRLRFIPRARDLGFSMEEIRELLGLWTDQTRPSREVKRVTAHHIDEFKQKIAQMRSMVGTLEHLAEGCHGDHRPARPILHDLSREDHDSAHADHDSTTWGSHRH